MTTGDHTMRTKRLYSRFFAYLTDAPRSPLNSSIAKLEAKIDRWHHILAAPYYYNDIQLDEWAAEATKMGRAHEALARQESTKTFDKLIQASLEDGDGWIHKYLKNDKHQTPHHLQ